MKKLVLSAILLAAATFSYAQVMVNGVDINKLDIQYIEIYAASGLGASVRINYGQATTNIMTFFDPFIDPRDSKPFRNSVAALNYLYQNGWELMAPSIRSGDEEQPSYMLHRREGF
ncbi:MAG: hypothetical protein IPH04_13410 [Saprospirales bacterium]|jgi:hypothetical protein|nr:hypothetical protein [Saprospirales bacterium]